MWIFYVLTAMLICRMFASGQDSSDCFVTEPVCPNVNVSFFLYTRASQFSPTRLESSNNVDVNFVPNRPVIVLIHGYTGHRDYAPNTSIRPAYFEKDDFNIISVDYNPLVREPCYFQAIRNLKVVSNCTAQLLDNLIENGIVSLESIHVVGFSLGAHTAGMIANFLKSGKLSRVTGLDPAMPGFMAAENMNRIDKSDAMFVDIIHTDIFMRGIFEPVGHVDFYPNNGYNQPGCQDQENETKGECNHNRAHLYYAESINSSVGFWGSHCIPWLQSIGLCQPPVNMLVIAGEYTPPNSRGIYYFNTNSSSPFALG